MSYTIEKNIPLPDSVAMYETLRKLEVGDSFQIEEADKYRFDSAIAKLRREAFTDTSDREFVSRTVGENQRRIWRIR